MPQINTAGRHSVTAQNSEIGESNTGTPFLRIGFINEDGDYIDAYLYLSEAALPYSIKTLRDAFAFDGNFETLTEQVDGKEASIVCEFEEYDGKDRLRVKFVNGPRKTIPIEDRNAMLKALSAKAARIPNKAPAAAAPTRGGAPARAPARVSPRKVAPAPTNPDMDEDVPF